MKIHYCEQRSPEWYEVRLGKVTSSNFKNVIANGRGSAPSKTRNNYMIQLIAERITSEKQDYFLNDDMIHGMDTEQQAKDFYEWKEGVEIEEVGFIEHSEDVGVSPDGLIGTNGMIEIKCPKTTTQVQRVLDGIFPSEYKAQVQGQLWVAEREWCDFISFDPRIISSAASYFKIRVYRDEEYIKQLESKTALFVDEMKTMMEKLT